MSTRQPAVSVVLPTHNRLASLPAAIESVLSQSFGDLELLVVDDASTDGTAEMLGAVGDERLRVLGLASRSGAPAARNAGLAAAVGRHIAFQDSDVIWRPGKLDAQVALLEGAPGDVAVVYGAVVRRLAVGDLRIPRAKDRVLEGDLSAVLPGGNFIDLPAALVRSAVLREAGGFDERVPRLQDWDLWLALSRRHQFLYLDEVVADSAETPGSISLDRGAYFEAVAIILQKHAELFAAAPEAALMYRLQLAHRALVTHRMSELLTEVRAAWAVGGWRSLRTVARRVGRRRPGTVR